MNKNQIIAVSLYLSMGFLGGCTKKRVNCDYNFAFLNRVSATMSETKFGVTLYTRQLNEKEIYYLTAELPNAIPIQVTIENETANIWYFLQEGVYLPLIGPGDIARVLRINFSDCAPGFELAILKNCKRYKKNCSNIVVKPLEKIRKIDSFEKVAFVLLVEPDVDLRDFLIVLEDDAGRQIFFNLGV